MLKPRSEEPCTEMYIFPFGLSSEPRAHRNPGSQWYLVDRRTVVQALDQLFFSGVSLPCDSHYSTQRSLPLTVPSLPLLVVQSRLRTKATGRGEEPPCSADLAPGATILGAVFTAVGSIYQLGLWYFVSFKSACFNFLFSLFCRIKEVP